MAAGGKRSGRIIILLALLLIIGLGAVVVLFRDQLLPGNQPATVDLATPIPQEPMITIVITTQFIQRGTTLSENVLTTVPYPQKDMVQGTFFTSVSEAVGKQTKYDLEARVPLTSSMVVDSMVGSLAAFQIPRGMVAISIPITRLTSVSFAPLPGDHVNLIASIMLTDLDTAYQTRLPNMAAPVLAPGAGGEGAPPSIAVTINSGAAGTQGRVEIDPTLNQALYVVPSETQRPRTVSQTLIQDAIVLHVGSYLDANGQYVRDNSEETTAAEPTPTPIPEAQVEEEPPALPMPEEITLVVSPQDAVTLNYLMLIGAKLNLALRSAGDTDKVKTEAVTLQFLMDQYAIPNPSKLPFGIEPRRDCLSFPSEACEANIQQPTVP